MQTRQFSLASRLAALPLTLAAAGGCDLSPQGHPEQARGLSNASQPALGWPSAGRAPCPGWPGALCVLNISVPFPNCVPTPLPHVLPSLLRLSPALVVAPIHPVPVVLLLRGCQSVVRWQCRRWGTHPASGGGPTPARGWQGAGLALPAPAHSKCPLHFCVLSSFEGEQIIIPYCSGLTRVFICYNDMTILIYL